MYSRQKYMHSPSVNKPQSYFSRILLPDERSKATHTPRKSKRSSYCRDTLSSPPNSKRHVSLPQWNLCVSSDQTTDGSRMPTLFDFQPDPGYSSMAFKRHLRRGDGALSQSTRVRNRPTVPVAPPNETVERALRILYSRKRTPLHLDTNVSPASDLLPRSDSVDQDSKRRCLMPSSYPVDVASIGIAKENDAFQFTSLDQLKRKQSYQETTNVNHVTSNDVYCSVAPSPVQRVLDAESSSFQSRDRTPRSAVRSPLVETPKSASSIRRLIPYMSPAELDALFFNKSDKCSKYSADKAQNDLDDDDDEFVGVSSHLVNYHRVEEPPTVKLEETTKGSDVCGTPQCHISELVSSSGAETTPESDRNPRVGSVARFIANLEARGRKASHSTGLTSSSRSNSLLSSPFQSTLPFRSPSEISTRVDRIRKLLSSQSDHPAKLSENSPSLSEKMSLPNLSATTGFSAPLAFGSPSSSANLVSTTTTASTLSSISCAASNSSDYALTLTAKPSLTTASSAITTSLNTLSSTGMNIASSGVPSPAVSSTPTFSLSTIKPSDTIKVPSVGISIGASSVAPSKSLMDSVPTMSMAPAAPAEPVSVAFKFNFPNAKVGNTATTSVSLSTTSTNPSGLPAFSVPTTTNAASTAMTTSKISIPSTTSATNTTPITTTSTTVPQFSTDPTSTSLSLGISPVSSTTPKFPLPFGASVSSTVASIAPPVQTLPSSGLFNFATSSSSSTAAASSTTSNKSMGLGTSSLFPLPTPGTPSISTTKTPTTAVTFGTALSTTSSPFTFNNSGAPNTTISSTSSLGFSTMGSSNTVAATTATASSHSPFTFKPTSIATTTTSTTTSLSSTTAPPTFTFSKPSFTFGGSSTSVTSTTTPNINTTSNSITQPTFTGFNFGSGQSSKPSTFNLFSAAVTTANQIVSTTTSSSSNLFTLGMKSASFTNAAAVSTPPTTGSLFIQPQPTSTNTFGGSTAVTSSEGKNPLSFSFGTPGSSTQLTSSATAPSQLFQFGVNSFKAASTTNSFSIPVVTTAAFSFGQQPATTGVTTSSASSDAFKVFGTLPAGGATGSVTTTTPGPFLFGTSPALANTAFNFSSPSVGAVGVGSSTPVFGSSTGFNFGQPVSFGNQPTTQPNPFAFGTTPPAAPGTGGAVAIARRRPASARRTRRP